MSNNMSPEEQKAYKEQLQQTVAMYDAEIKDMQDNIAQLQQQVRSYQQTEQKYPMLKIGYDLAIRWTNHNISQKQTQVAEYQTYRQRAVAEMESLNPIQGS